MTPIDEIFCEIDDFCKDFYPAFQRGLLPNPEARRQRAVSMTMSEIMTILVLFHLSHYRDFKNFYLDCVERQMQSHFPTLLSYNRFVEIQGRVFAGLCAFLLSRAGTQTGLYFVDSTALAVCHPKRIHSHKTFEDIAKRGHTSVGWFFGMKLHIAINHIGEIMAFALTPGNTDDRKPVPKLLRGLTGTVAGDKGYISAKMAGNLAEDGIDFITKVRRNMKDPQHTSFHKWVLSKRGIVETVIDQLKSVCQIEHTRHRKPDNFVLNLLAALAAYALKQRKPKITVNGIQTQALIPN